MSGQVEWEEDVLVTSETFLYPLNCTLWATNDFYQEAGTLISCFLLYPLGQMKTGHMVGIR